MSVTAFIGLGSNLGDRVAHLDAAVNELRTLPGIKVLAISRYWETEPVGGPPGQDKYLNAVAKLETDLSARELLTVLLAIEDRNGRERKEPSGPRTLDLDLLLYGDEKIDEPDLRVPHPRMHERTFVLGPLVEIAGDVMHPVLGQRAIDLLLLGKALPARLLSWALPAQGTKVVVTGSSSGIGAAMALSLAKAGADVLVHARTSEYSANAVCDAIRKLGRRSEAVLADLRDGQVLAKFAEEAWKDFGPIDVWVNNAGADVLTAASAGLTFDLKLEQLWQVDVLATIRLSRLIGARMKERGQGVIINVGWDQAETGMDGDSGQLFAATKGAVMAFTKSLALTLAPQVRVNCIAPGWIKTAWGEKASPSWQQRAVGEAPLQRLGTPDDVAAVACWLASPQASFITGQIIRVNGGAVR